MTGRFLGILGAACLLLSGAPAMAGRTAIDQTPDGDPIYATLSGYCDFNGADCGANSGVVLPYLVSVGGGDFTNRLFVHGNGLLTFGSAVDFYDPAISGAIYDQQQGGAGPSLSDYGLTLVSAGQSNILDYDVFNGDVFLQSAVLGVDGATGAITASWFRCYAPTAPGVCPQSNAYSLILTPTQGGYSGRFDFTAGLPDGDDRGFVSGGVYTRTGDSFFLPAAFDGLSVAPGVPEPATWLMMILGFGFVGSALRRKRGAAVPA